MMTSDTCSAFTPVASSSPRITRAPSSAAGSFARPPPNLPTAVRNAAVMTTSLFMWLTPRLWSVCRHDGPARPSPPYAQLLPDQPNLALRHRGGDTALAKRFEHRRVHLAARGTLVLHQHPRSHGDAHP